MTPPGTRPSTLPVSETDMSDRGDSRHLSEVRVIYRTDDPSNTLTVDPRSPEKASRVERRGSEGGVLRATSASVYLWRHGSAGKPP